MTVKKVNIDELIHLLMDFRQHTEFVDIEALEENTLKVRAFIEKKSTKPPEQEEEDTNQFLA